MTSISSPSLARHLVCMGSLSKKARVYHLQQSYEDWGVQLTGEDEKAGSARAHTSWHSPEWRVSSAELEICGTTYSREESRALLWINIKSKTEVIKPMSCKTLWQIGGVVRALWLLDEPFSEALSEAVTYGSPKYWRKLPYVFFLDILLKLLWWKKGAHFLITTWDYEINLTFSNCINMTEPERLPIEGGCYYIQILEENSQDCARRAWWTLKRLGDLKP